MSICLYCFTHMFRIIYWSDWGTPPRIEKANMDGSERETLVDFKTAAWPNGLAFDLQGLLLRLSANQKNCVIVSSSTLGHQ